MTFARTVAALTGLLISLNASAQGLHSRSATGKDISIALAPSSADARWLKAELASYGPSFMVEAVVDAPRPARLASFPPGDRATAYSNILRSVSSLKGLRYYSVFKGKEAVLFQESYCVAPPSAAARGPGSIVRLADPLIAGPVPYSMAYAYQKDSTMGEAVWSLEYRQTEALASLAIQNVSGLSLGPFPAVGPGGIRIIVSTSEKDGQVEAYALCMARVPLLPGLTGFLESSFSNRAEALLSWFLKSLAAAGGELASSGGPAP
jgi:hypothetical protein